MNRKRALLYVALALAVPLPALALSGGSGAASLEVHASLDRCGVAGGSIVCTINASFNRLADAEYYTASVTAADGSVTDVGTVAEGGGAGTASAAVSVPYVGNGEYTVTISAWGYDERGKPEVVKSDEAGAEGGEKRAGEAETVTVPEPPVEEETEPAPAPPPVEPDEDPECAETEVPPEAAAPDANAAPAPAPEAEAPTPAVPPEEAAPDPCEPPQELPAPPATP